MKKSDVITKLEVRIAELEKDKAPKENKGDNTVCPECGGDLEYVEEGTVYCPKCKQYYDVEEEAEE